jgi:imidazolonepropionase-like amidohydrolase
MKKLLPVLCLLLATLCVACGAPPVRSEARAVPKPLVFTHVTVIDATGSPAQPGMTVVIEGGRITEIGQPSVVNVPGGAEVVDATGKFLIPGLWDMHVHTVFGDWLPGGKEISLPLFIANGVTGVRDMGGELAVLAAWRSAIERGELLGPRIVLSGPMLDGPTPRFPSSIAIRTPDDGRRAVADLKRRGADFIKLQSLIPREAVLAIADEARKQGIPFAGHVPDAVRASEASSAGQRSFEHLIGIFEGSSRVEDELLKGPKGPKRFLETFDPVKAAALIELLAKNQTWQCPTLVWERGGNLIEESDFEHDARARYAPTYWKERTWRKFTDQILHEFNTDDLATRKQFVEKELELVGAMHRAGVPFLAGTDTAAGVYVFPGFSLHEELQLFVKAGFTPMEALQTATRNPSRFLGLSDQLGTVEKGKAADLVLLSGNPLEDIQNTQKIAGVILHGRYLSRADLDELLRKIEAAARLL